jgi:secondary thiamine-phosphate synthase enzyme
VRPGKAISPDFNASNCSRYPAPIGYKLGFQAFLEILVLLPDDLFCHNGRVKSLTEHLWFEVPERRGFVNITSTVEDLVRKSGVQDGLCLVNAMHITASVFINDDESGLHHDYEVWLEKLAPHAPTSQYQHNRTGEDNADAHLKRQVMGREVVIAITKGKLDFGPWEQIFYGEFDGRRRKRALVKIIGE